MLHYLDELESNRLALLDYKATSDKELLATLAINNLPLTPKQLFQQFGLKKALETINPNELRQMLAHCSQRAWYRLMVDAKQVMLPNRHEPFTVIRNCIKKLKPLHSPLRK